MSPTFRYAFWLCCAVGIATIWLAPHLPQTDLPQHAGQVTLLRDLASGESIWAADLRINPLTPYLLGYAALYALSSVLTIETGIAVLYSMAYLGFVAAFIALRRQVDADDRLDWFVLPVFFGLAWRWGFLTFLVAAPIGMCLLTAAFRFSGAMTLRRALLITFIGVGLLFSHGLVFIYGVSVGLLIVLAGRQPLQQRLVDAFPFVLLLLGFIVYKITVLDPEMQKGTGSTAIEWGDLRRRLSALLVYPIAATVREFYAAPAISVACYAAPWVLGIKPRFRLSTAIPFAGTVLIILVLPTSVSDAGFFYDRFALFLLPTYALLFARRPLAERGSEASVKVVAVQAALVVSAALVLAREAVYNLAFARESRTIDEALGRLEAGRKVLYIPLDKSAELAPLQHAYLHYPMWYQAKHRGLVEFNFAFLLPQVVRYRNHDMHPGPSFPWLADRFVWRSHEVHGYTYVVFRSTGPVPPVMLEPENCPLSLVESFDRWSIFRNTCKPAVVR